MAICSPSISHLVTAFDVLIDTFLQSDHKPVEVILNLVQKPSQPNLLQQHQQPIFDTTKADWEHFQDLLSYHSDPTDITDIDKLNEHINKIIISAAKQSIPLRHNSSNTNSKLPPHIVALITKRKVHRALVKHHKHSDAALLKVLKHDFNCLTSDIRTAITTHNSEIWQAWLDKIAQIKRPAGLFGLKSTVSARTSRHPNAPIRFITMAKLRSRLKV